MKDTTGCDFVDWCVVLLTCQIIYDPSPSPPADRFSREFRSFVDACLQKDADARPTAEQVSVCVVFEC